eukprot:Opistho-1_new@96758
MGMIDSGPAFAGTTSSVERGVSPVEPRAERFDIGGVDGRAAPDAKARRRVAIARDVISRAFGFEQRGELLDEALVGARNRQADRSLRPAGGIGGEMAQPLAFLDNLVERRGVRIAARLQTIETAERFRPFERKDRIFDREHRRGVDRLALEHALGERALRDEAEHLRQRPGGGVIFKPFDRARADDQHAVAAFTAEYFLPAEGRDVDLVPRQVVSEHRAGRVGEAQAPAVGGDPVAVRNADAARRAVPGEKHVVRPVDLAEVGKLAVIGADDGRIELELLRGVGDPALAEALPSERRHGAGAEHRPHRHFKGAGVAARNDADAVRVGKLQHLAHQVDAVLQTRLADLRTMRAAERFGVQFFRGPDRRLGAGSGRKIRARRAQYRRRHFSHYSLSLQRARAALGPRGPAPRLGWSAQLSNKLHGPGEIFDEWRKRYTAC